jgi:hypothetical protein
MSFEYIDGRRVAVFENDNGRIVVDCPADTPTRDPNPLDALIVPRAEGVCEVPSRDGAGTIKVHVPAEPQQ